MGAGGDLVFKVNLALQLTNVLANQVIGTCILYVINAIIVYTYFISEPCEYANFSSHCCVVVSPDSKLKVSI